LRHCILNCLYIVVLVERDMKERERPLEQILHQYITYVKPAFEEFCLPVSMYKVLVFKMSCKPLDTKRVIYP